MKKLMRRYELKQFTDHISGQKRTDTIKELYNHIQYPNNLEYELHSMSSKSDQAAGLAMGNETSKR